MINYPRYNKLPSDYLKSKIADFLAEDMPKGDITSEALFKKGDSAIALLINQEDLVFAGQSVLKQMFWAECDMEINCYDGDLVAKNTIIARIMGEPEIILARERVLLNLLQRLCGIATETKKYVEQASKFNVKILDTRKTSPGLRLFDKFAVACGGGYNHRLDLSSGILIKDNHIKAAGSITEAVNLLRDKNPGIAIEVEVENIMEIKEALNCGVEGLLLDNMNPESVGKAVKLIRAIPNGDNVFIEASGGININNIDDYLPTGINAISIGALTHSVRCSELHLEFE